MIVSLLTGRGLVLAELEGGKAVEREDRVEADEGDGGGGGSD